MKYKLGECIEEIVDKTTENNQYEVLSVTKDGIYSQEEFFKKQIASEDNTGYKIIRKNNLVFSTMNLWMGSLDVLLNYEIGIVSPAYKIFKFDESKMTPSFGKYFMKSHFMLEQYKNCSEQGASVVRKNLDLKQLLDTEIIIPTVEEQCKIVKVLENIDEIINKYTNLIKNKEQFIKSQFVEMFENEMYLKKRMDEVAILKSGTTFSKGYELDNGEMLYCKVSDMNLEGNEKYMKTSKNYVSKEVGSKSCLPVNSVIFPKRGGAIGTNKKRILIADTCVDLNTMGVIPKEQLNVQYLYYYFINIDLATLCDGSAVPQLNNKNIGPLEISMPPMEIQNKFAKIVEQIDKQKFHSVLKNIIKVKESEVYA